MTIAISWCTIVFCSTLIHCFMNRKSWKRLSSEYERTTRNLWFNCMSCVVSAIVCESRFLLRLIVDVIFLIIILNHWIRYITVLFNNWCKMLIIMMMWILTSSCFQTKFHTECTHLTLRLIFALKCEFFSWCLIWVNVLLCVQASQIVCRLSRWFDETWYIVHCSSFLIFVIMICFS